MKTFLFILSTLIAGHSQATSCRGMTDTIIAQCNDDICGEMFFVEEVHFGDECRRRPMISKPPIWAKAVIEYEMNLLDENSKTGVYELSIQNRRWWVPSKHNNLKQYIRNKGDEWSRPEININLVTHSADQFKKLTKSLEGQSFRCSLRND